ncbi:alpha/beta hydrolase [Roseateles sp. MS654]|uniref:alpha/beta hydrolase n=1 Tax=Roseateles sp. MS654 TaxID=3412685 RepID=UPI003C3080D7
MTRPTIPWMPRPRVHALCGALLLSFTAAGCASGTEEVTPDRARANFARPVVLASDDVRAFPAPPAGFDVDRAGTPHGAVESFSYDSGVTGTRRQASVYLPPGYTKDRKYPVLYLLHGIGGNQHEWTGYVRAPAVLDNLIAAGKAVPMIVVMPNGRALPDDSVPPPDRIFTAENAAGFAKFERDLLDFLIPAVEARYAALPDRRHRAVAGLSMGGGQALNFGFAHPEVFAAVGGFSSAPNTRPPAELIPDPETVRRQFALVYLSCGSRDGLISVSQGVHRQLKQQGVPHLWNVDGSGHDRESWAENLHHFAQRLFR